ncbi:MAG: hypothetical protein AB1793_02065 [Candidatus Thermoplasmatota archaeon]
MREAKKSSISQILKEFKCERDLDVQKFLRKNAIKYEESNRTRTYLLIEKEDPKGLRVVGYFSLALGTLRFGENIDGTTRKQLTGSSSRENAPCYLLGQLGKDDSCGNETLGPMLIQRALNIIQLAQDHIGGCFVMVDCRDEDRLCAFYYRNGFSRIQKDERGQYLQLVRSL